MFAFVDAKKRRIYFIYNYKRGYWYPFVPAPGDAQERSTERELQLKAQMGLGNAARARTRALVPCGGSRSSSALGPRPAPTLPPSQKRAHPSPLAPPEN